MVRTGGHKTTSGNFGIGLGGGYRSYPTYNYRNNYPAYASNRDGGDDLTQVIQGLSNISNVFSLPDEHPANKSFFPFISFLFTICLFLPNIFIIIHRWIRNLFMSEEEKQEEYEIESNIIKYLEDENSELYKQIEKKRVLFSVLQIFNMIETPTEKILFFILFRRLLIIFKKVEKLFSRIKIGFIDRDEKNYSIILEIEKIFNWNSGLFEACSKLIINYKISKKESFFLSKKFFLFSYKEVGKILNSLSLLNKENFSFFKKKFEEVFLKSNNQKKRSFFDTFLYVNYFINDDEIARFFEVFLRIEMISIIFDEIVWRRDIGWKEFYYSNIPDFFSSKKESKNSKIFLLTVDKYLNFLFNLNSEGTDFFPEPFFNFTSKKEKTCFFANPSIEEELEQSEGHNIIVVNSEFKIKFVGENFLESEFFSFYYDYGDGYYSVIPREIILFLVNRQISNETFFLEEEKDK